MSLRGLWMLLVLMPLAGCNGGSDRPNAAEPAVSSRVESNDPNDVVLPPHRALANNPLGLPYPETEAMAQGDHVYAVVRESLLDAALGKTLVLRLSRIVGQEGEQLLVRQPSGVPYAIHPAYVVPLRRGRFRRRGSVLAPRGGRMTHAAVRTFRRKKIVVQYIDVGLRLGQRAIARNQLGILTGALEAGGFAIFEDGPLRRHVTLVSKGTHRDGKARWLVLSYGSVATLVDHERLRRLPRTRRLKAGDEVLVAWRGLMTPGVVGKVEPSGLMAVKRPRFGGLTTAGPGMVVLR